MFASFNDDFKAMGDLSLIAFLFAVSGQSPKQPLLSHVNF
ncbi:hypothetical protein B4129_2615 [Bacillus safensis]|nr:hypothetical protein B4129_2615 [Bacillus safensis]